MKSLSDDARKAIQTAVQRWIDVDDISQSALAAELGVSQATISKVYLYGDAGPAVQEKVAKKLGISVQELSGMKPSDEHDVLPARQRAAEFLRSSLQQAISTVRETPHKDDTRWTAQDWVDEILVTHRRILRNGENDLRNALGATILEEDPTDTMPINKRSPWP